MTSRVIGAPDDMTPAWMSCVLRRNEAIASGVVTSLTTAAAGGDNSQGFHIHVHYDAGATGDLPVRLWLKTCTGGQFGPSEVLYYTRDYLSVPDAPLLLAYDAAYDAGRGAYHLLLGDVSLTHHHNHGRIPTSGYAAALGRAFAALHAAYWHDAQKATIGAVVPDAAAIRRALAPAESGLEPMLGAAGDAIVAGWSDGLREVWRRYPVLLEERTRNSTGFTVVHGDPNPGNILSPLHNDEPLWLIDRQPFPWSLTTWLGAGDLAYALVHWWDVDRRRALEEETLRAWHGALVARDITDYSWQQAWDDYRLCAVMSLYVAAEWCVNARDREEMRWVWLPQLHRSLAAFRDLACGELLEIALP